MPDYITTYGGTHFFPTQPDMRDFHIGDVAHALSLLCRGNGHVRQFFSVGQHCIYCALEARARGFSSRIVLACLLHDASEAYMSDVPRPFKKYLKDYQVLEDRLLTLVYEKYLGSDVTEEEAGQMKQIDNDVLAYDMFYLLGEGCEEELPKLERSFSYEVRPFEDVEREYLEIFHSESVKMGRNLSGKHQER